MDFCWKLSSVESDVAEVEITITQTKDGWHGTLEGDGATATAASVTDVRTTLAAKVKEQLQTWAQGNGDGDAPFQTQISRIRLFTHLVTEHARSGSHQGQVIDVAALADRVPGGWVARTVTGHLTVAPEYRERRLIMEILSGTSTSHVEATGQTFAEAQTALSGMVMQELDFGADQTYPDWSAARLTVTTRKTLEVAALS
ncbi:hypothetical protein [Nocardiopsis sp. FR26]|uniref:hypothetical protein n=1 Tax=Nocardiopsis sp. FR26 TaxID=2605987 RepID=UPI00135AB65E|nr:hypothetical protein [Nocardiopsis sp. FR26]